MFLLEFVDFNGSQLFLDNSGYDSLGTEGKTGLQGEVLNINLLLSPYIRVGLGCIYQV